MDRKPLKRSETPLARTAMKRSTTPINPVSKHRQRVNRIRSRNLLEAWGPRPWFCVLAGRVSVPCFGPVNAHEILRRGLSGRDENLTDPTGMAPLCDHHNDWVANDGEQEARALGLSIHSWEELDAAS